MGAGGGEVRRKRREIPRRIHEKKKKESGDYCICFLLGPYFIPSGYRKDVRRVVFVALE